MSSKVRAQSQLTTAEWWTVAGNPERTSWVSEEVYGSNLALEWYKPIEAYIPQNSQLIATNDMIYVSSARGLYALRYDTGDVAWQFNTELPLGNSPTVTGGVAYVGGMDKKLYALDANTGALLWSFDNATAGYSANPLVVNGVIYAANRDGYLYAIGAHGATRQGQEIWKFKSGGPIVQSPAYKNNTIYFAANDNYGYAVNTDGNLKWKSIQKLTGDGYQSYWPVIYINPVDNKDYVIFTAAQAYKHSQDPGVSSLTYQMYLDSATGAWDCNPALSSTCTLTTQRYAKYETVQKDEIFNSGWAPSITNYRPPGGILPTVSLTDSWAQGRTVYNGSQISEYLENKPWRKVMVVLDAGNGQEFTQDVDSDGKPDPAPVAYWGTHSGNMYPPAVGTDNNLYVHNVYSVNGSSGGIAQGRVYGWRMGTPYLIDVGGQGAMDEPSSISIGGNLMYRSICCDRVGSYSDLRPLTVSNRITGRALWNYSNPIANTAPDYELMWWGTRGSYERLTGNYGGNSELGAPHNGKNGIYHSHGAQNPMIPYKGKVFIFRGNSVLAYGTGTSQGSKGLLRISAKNDSLVTPSVDDLKARLEAEINKMDVDGDGALDNLRPGYYNAGQANGRLSNYFENPGDTLLALTRAYPYLSTTTQDKVKALLQTEFTTYFSGVCNPLNNPTANMCARRGWAEGQPREAMLIPDDLTTSLSNGRPSTWVGYNWSWTYPQHNFYAMWKYAQIFPEQATTVYNLAKGKLQVPVPASANLDWFQRNTWELNGYIAGYIGFLELQKLGGMENTDAALRSQVQDELNRLEGLWASSISKDSPWVNPTDPDNLPLIGGSYHNRSYNIARIFMNLVPEFGNYLNQNSLAKVQDAWSDYNYVAPYWFVSRYDSIHDEGSNSPLDTYYALFQAKAYILKQPYSELAKYLDVPAFERGDLFYIQNLTAALEVSQAGSTDINGDTKVDLFDLQLLFENWNTPRDRRADINSDNVVNGVDFGLVLRDWGES